ncbi:hypothetical protein AB1Y20_019540 [Prymnesium parvum]|uniref:Major facilitator superfamily (MFS) profile domain-containing protein n=1 Tax=Prymnesium parvum TaxID=97485 RepID=A0AB34JUD8_PRYPA
MDDSKHPAVHPLFLLLCVMVAMTAIGHCQYTWTLFVPSIKRSLHVNFAQVQLGFSIFITLQTCSVLALGVLVTPKLYKAVMCAGSLLIGGAYYGLSVSSQLGHVYVCCAALGMGVGCVYNGCVSLAVRLFPRNRGLASGMAASGYGGGTLLTVSLLRSRIESDGYQLTFRWLGVYVSLISLAASSLLPHELWMEKKMEEPPPHLYRMDVPLKKAVRKDTFWLLYLLLVLITFVGLVVTAQLRPLAEAFDIPIKTFVYALQERADRMLNFISRPLWGSVSDVIGRLEALGLAFSMQAVVLVIWSAHLGDESYFVICSALSTFSWGEVYSIFPAIAADLYGVQHVSATFGALYTGKAVASILAGPVVSVVSDLLSWYLIIEVMAFLSLLDALLAVFVLKPRVDRETRPPAITLA